MFKKFTASILIFTVSLLQVNCAVWAKQYKNYNKTYKSSKKPSVKPVKKKTVKKKPEFIIPLVEDEAAQALDKTKYKKNTYKKTILQDEKIVTVPEKKHFKRPKYQGVSYTDRGCEVRIKPVRKISTKNKSLKLSKGEKNKRYKVALPAIGETVEFTVVNDVERNGKILIHKGSRVHGTVGEVSPRAMGGAPAEMTLENFEIIDAKGNATYLFGDVSSSGYSLSVWIGLAELATTPFLFGLAVPLLRVLPGGQAVITPRKEYVVYFYEKNNN